MLARTVPQMNVFIVGFPVQMAVGVSLLVVSLTIIQMLLERALHLLERDLVVLIGFFAG